MKRITTLIVAMSAVCCKPNDRADIAGMDRLCAGVFPEGRPGAAVLIMKGDDVVFEKCYGIADMDTMAPITPETSFNIASVSKQFTAAAILQLCEQGRMSLDDRVCDHFPEFQGKIWEKVRIRHLLSHSSGIPDLRKYMYSRQERIYGTDSLAVAYMKELDSLTFEPGTQYEYINPTFVLAGYIVERVSGEKFTEYIDRHIFKPAGMTHTSYFDPVHQELIPNMSHAYQDSGEGVWKRYEYGDETFFASRPDGGIYTSIRDFAKWEKAQRDSVILRKETLDDAQSPHIPVSGSPYCDYQNRPNTWYGYGWFIEPAVPGQDSGRKGNLVYHTGDNGGFKIMAARYPESDTMVLIFSNRNDWCRYKLLKELEKFL